MTHSYLNYPIDAIRSQFLALHRPDEHGQLPIFFDSPGGSQLPKSVVEAVADYLYHFNSNMGGQAHAGRVTNNINHNARAMAGLWLNAKADNIFFGLNSTSLMFQVARSLKNTWQAGDNIVVSDIDHFSHVSSWQSVAQEVGVEVRFMPLKQDGSALDIEQSITLIDERTQLVAYSLASNVLGSKTNHIPLAKRAKEVGAVLSLDAVHAIVHEPVDVEILGCDLAFASAYKMGGCHLGMCYMADTLLTKLIPYKVEPACNQAPMSWEQGTQSFEAQASLVALIHYWISLSGEQMPSVANIKKSYRIVENYENFLSNYFLQHALKRPYIRLYGQNSAQARTPTFAFNLQKNDRLITPSQVSHWFGKKNIALPSGHFYAQNIVKKLNLSDIGLLRVGFLHYSHSKEIDTLFALLDEFVEKINL